MNDPNLHPQNETVLHKRPVHPVISHCMFEHPLSTSTPIQGHATALYKT
jgi:hypothetical protein